MVVIDGNPRINVVNDKEALLDAVIKLDLSCETLVWTVEYVVMVITDCVIVSFGCVLIIKIDLRVNVSANITQLMSVENTVMTIAKGSIRFR